MACYIDFRHGDWKISGNAFCTLATGLQKELSDKTGGAELQEKLTSAVESGIYYLDLSDLKDESILRALQTSLESYVMKLKIEDLSDIDEERFAAYLKKLNELSILVETNLKRI